jgi:hypothetical protein
VKPRVPLGHRDGAKRKGRGYCICPDGRAKVQITYMFAPPVQAASGATDNKTFEILAGETPIPEALGRL